MATHDYTDYSIFVGDLAYEVDDVMLEQTFRTYYPTTKHAKVMIDPVTGRSRGFGFVRFTNEAERDRAMQEMNGVYIGSKQVRCSLATQKPKPGGSAGATSPVPAQAAGGPSHPSGPSGGGSSLASTVTTGTRRDDREAGDQGPPNNTTLFIGGLSSSVSEAELHAAFARCGEIVYVKIPPGKGCGFVQFVTRGSAEYALETLNGLVMGGMPIRVSWGKSTKAPPHAGGPPGHHAPGAYPPAAGYYAAGYDPYAPAAYGAYGYGMDPYGYGAYAADPYAAYPGYGAHPAAVHGAAHPAAAAAAAAAANAAAAHAGPGAHAGAMQPVLYDPLAPVDVTKMNMAYMHRHVPVLAGTFVRVPIAMAPMPPGVRPATVPTAKPAEPYQRQQ